MQSHRVIRGVLLDLAREHSGEDAKLQFDDAAIVHLVIEYRVSDQGIHALLEAVEKLTPAHRG